MMGKRSLPPGFRFHPTDVELVRYYLKRKVLGKKLHYDAIAELDIYKFAPCDLPGQSCLRSGDLKWYFFCPRGKKYASGARMNRATYSGYWKTTGKDRHVHYNDEVAGMIKTLVFHEGRAPKGNRTDWVMYEYRLEDRELADKGVAQDSYVLCAIFKKDGPGPKTGAQYGAPFNDEDWDDDDDVEEVNVQEAVSHAGMLPTAFVLPINQSGSIATIPHFPTNVYNGSSVSNPSESGTSAAAFVLPVDQHGSVATSSQVPVSVCNGSSVSCPLESLPSAYDPPNAVWDNNASLGAPQVVHEDDVNGDDILELLDLEVDKSKNAPIFDGNVEDDGIDIFKDLEDLHMAGDISFGDDNSRYFGDQMVQGDNRQYLELTDLDAPLNCCIEAGGYEHVQTGPINDDNTCCNCMGESCYPANPCSVAQLVAGFGQSSMLPEVSNGYNVGQVNVFNKEDGVHGNSNHGYIAYDPALHNNDNATRFETSEMGSRHNSLGLRRGEQQRFSHTRLQYLESEQSCLSSPVVKNSASIIGAKRSKVYAFFSPYVGSHIYVKAEVTSMIDECTNDALSDKLESTPFVHFEWSNQPKMEFRKGFAIYGIVFAFVSCLLGILIVCAAAVNKNYQTWQVCVFFFFLIFGAVRI